VKHLVTILFVVLILPTCIPRAEQSKPTTTRKELFGIQLRPRAIELLAEVEKLYGRPVVEEDNTNTVSKSGLGDAAANILRNGSPVIKINTLKGKDEDSIVHELFHLKLFAQGYSLPPAIRKDGKFTEEAFVHILSAFIHDPLQHSIIFPEMRKMGFDPDSLQRVTVRKAIKTKKFDIEGRSPSDTSRILALYYFQFSLHIEDKDLLSAMEKLYTSSEWDDALSKGRRMLAAAKAAAPYTPETMIAAYVKCLNIFHENEVQFFFNQWVQKYDDIPVVRVAVIDVKFL
jgi:hypothetical protein